MLYSGRIISKYPFQFFPLRLEFCPGHHSRQRRIWRWRCRLGCHPRKSSSLSVQVRFTPISSVYSSAMLFFPFRTLSVARSDWIDNPEEWPDLRCFVGPSGDSSTAISLSSIGVDYFLEFLD